MPRSREQELAILRDKVKIEFDACLTKSGLCAAWKYSKPLRKALLTVLRAIDRAASQALWRLIWSTSAPLSEHEARQILRATQKKAKGREIHAPSPLSYPFQRPRGPVR